MGSADCNLLEIRGYNKTPVDVQTTGFRFQQVFSMAGMAGFEPANDGVKVRCLTAWLQPIMKKWGG